MTGFIFCVVIVVAASVVVYALTKGNVRTRLKLPGVDFSLETEDRKNAGPNRRPRRFE